MVHIEEMAAYTQINFSWFKTHVVKSLSVDRNRL
jgi:hypothetical protein